MYFCSLVSSSEVFSTGNLPKGPQVIIIEGGTFIQTNVVSRDNSKSLLSRSCDLDVPCYRCRFEPSQNEAVLVLPRLRDNRD
jgi:hypothetical protein